MIPLTQRSKRSEITYARLPAAGIAVTAARSEGAPSPRKLEDSAAGCRTMADDDHDRAEASDSDHMRVRLKCSADAWTARADLLDRLEANRAKIATQVHTAAPNSGPAEEKNDG
ncbi:MAG: hypothetical protein ABI770_10180 [Sphingomicrobium sp.]